MFARSGGICKGGGGKENRRWGERGEGSMEFLAGRKLRGKPALRRWQNTMNGQLETTMDQAVSVTFHLYFVGSY